MKKLNLELKTVIALYEAEQNKTAYITKKIDFLKSIAEENSNQDAGELLNFFDMMQAVKLDKNVKFI